MPIEDLKRSSVKTIAFFILVTRYYSLSPNGNKIQTFYSIAAYFLSRQNVWRDIKFIFIVNRFYGPKNYFT